MREDHAAYTGLYTSTSARLWSYVRREVESDMDADDITAAVWCGVWARWAAIDKPDHYVWRAARNAVIAHRRRERHHVSLDAPECADLPATDGDVETVTDRVDLDAALPVLTEQETALLRVRYVYDVPSTDLGVATGINAVTLRSRSFRALAKVRQRLSDGYAPTLLGAA